MKVGNKIALLSAAGNGDLKQVQSILKSQPNLITHKSWHGNNALHNAAANGRLEVVVWLVEHGGANLEIEDGKGKTALWRASNNNHRRVVEYLQGKTSIKREEGASNDNTVKSSEDTSTPSLVNTVGSGLRASVSAAGGAVCAVGSGVASLGSSTKKALGFGLGKVEIAFPAVIYMPGRDSIQGVVRLVDLPEPIQGTSLTVRLEAFREVTTHDREGRARRHNKQVYNFGQQLAGSQQYSNQQQFCFCLPVPVVEKKLSQGHDPSSLLGSVLGAADSLRSVVQNPLEWSVTAKLNVPYSLGIGTTVNVVVAEPGQTVPPLPNRAPSARARGSVRRAAPAPAASAPAPAPSTNNATVPEGMVPANGHLCRICYTEHHDSNTFAVACTNNHYMCQPCFSSWVSSQSDVQGNPQKVIRNGGEIYCVCKDCHNCDSDPFRNKLIATATTDEVYEKYLQARDFVVGKEAVSGVLSRLSSGDGKPSEVEEEQIRNMYRKGDDTFSAYMCGRCRFGPIDHGWCSDLSAHHGEEKRGSLGRPIAHVNNSCPKCGWFAEDISEWPTWDGSFQEATA